MNASTDETTPTGRSGRWTLGRALAFFWTRPSVWILAVGLVAVWAARIYLGDWNLWDLGYAVAVVAAWPFVEWLVHVAVLHLKPIEIGGKTFDFHLARKHRDHHQEPEHLPDIFIPVRSLLTTTLPTVLLIAWLVTPDITRMGTVLGMIFVMGLIYEWCHFLIHTNYRPRSALFKHLRRHHYLHHYKHEENWWGVSMTLGDKVLGTAPDFREIETSDTCRTLGVDTDPDG